jgi:hypothetical protein
MVVLVLRPFLFFVWIPCLLESFKCGIVWIAWIKGEIMDRLLLAKAFLLSCVFGCCV